MYRPRSLTMRSSLRIGRLARGSACEPSWPLPEPWPLPVADPPGAVTSIGRLSSKSLIARLRLQWIEDEARRGLGMEEGRLGRHEATGRRDRKHRFDRRRPNQEA